MNARFTFTVLCLVVWSCIANGFQAKETAVDEWAADLTDAVHSNGGFAVHIGCETGERTAALARGGSFLVQGLTKDKSCFNRTREFIREQGLWGQVTAANWDGKALPYIGNLVNLLIVDVPVRFPADELLRVLAPRGVALIKKLGNRDLIKGLPELRDFDDEYARYEHPWPDDIDEWTHFLHGADNNQVARDRKVAAPRRMQWIGDPLWTRHHGPDKGIAPAIRGMVSAGGRIFYLNDEATAASMRVPSKWCLIARDGFNGVILWKKALSVSSFPKRMEQLWRSLVAERDSVYCVLSPGGEVARIDAKTGETQRSYSVTVGTEEFVKSGKCLYAVLEDCCVAAVDSVSGKKLWDWSPGNGADVVPLTLAVSDGNVFVKTDDSICGLSGKSGRLLWRFEPRTEGKRKRLRWPREILIATDGVVLCSYGGTDPGVLNRDEHRYLGSHPRVDEYNAKLGAFSARTGELLWETGYRPGLESDPGEVYVIDGLVWLGPDFDEARDLRTGEVKAGRDGVIEQLWTDGHHYRCYPGKATVNYIITAKRGIEMIDIRGSDHSRNNWIRPTCRVGVTPCNGLLYVPPHSCGCYMEGKLFGFWAVTGSEENYPEQSDTGRLVRGPAYGKGQPAKRPDDEAWPMYRRDASRSACSPADPGHNLIEKWKASFSAEITPAVVSGKNVILCERDRHSVICLDAVTGKKNWSYVTGGRIDSPPTIYQGMVLAGSADGCVYCLRFSDGALIWKFRAAEKLAKTVAFGQVESVWPVHGSVLVKNDTAYVLAGRSSYLDGGMSLYALAPRTGEIKAERILRSKHQGATPYPPGGQAEEMRQKFRQNWVDYKTFLASDRSDSFSMAGSRRGILTADSRALYLRHLAFDWNLNEIAQVDPHLYSTSSLLDGTEIHRSHWGFGSANFRDLPVAYPWIANKEKRWGEKGYSVPHGLMLAFDTDTVWGIARTGYSPWKKKSMYVAFSQSRPRVPKGDSTLSDFRGGAPGTHWAEPVPLRPRALIKTERYLFAGGSSDRFNPKDPDDPLNTDFCGEGSGVLCVINAEDGEIVQTVELEACPVWDGMACSGDSLFVSMRNGRLLCLDFRPGER